MAVLAAPYAKPIALANVRAFSQRLDPKIQLIGTGGVTNGRDAYDLILAGASLVQVGTLLQEEGPAVFTRLSRELQAVMQTKGYTNLSDFKGQLKPNDERKMKVWAYFKHNAGDFSRHWGAYIMLISVTNLFIGLAVIPFFNFAAQQTLRKWSRALHYLDEPRTNSDS